MRNIFRAVKNGRLKDEGTRTVLSESVEGLTDHSKNEASGWVSPRYDKSRTMYLNPIIAAANRCAAAVPGCQDAEAYKVHRTHILQITEEGEGKTIMVTSALPGEGKTVTAINLAFTFAREFSQTVLLARLRSHPKQIIHEMLGIRSDKGLIDYLPRRRPRLRPDHLARHRRRLTFISGGRPISEAPSF